MCVGLVARLIVSMIAVTGNGFTIKEKVFIAIAWLPKATVQVGGILLAIMHSSRVPLWCIAQAAVGSIALDEAREKNAGEESLRLGRMVSHGQHERNVLQCILSYPTNPRLCELTKACKFS